MTTGQLEIKSLRERLEAKKIEARKIHDIVKTAGRTKNTEERKAFDALTLEINGIDAEIRDAITLYGDTPMGKLAPQKDADHELTPEERAKVLNYTIDVRSSPRLVADRERRMSAAYRDACISYLVNGRDGLTPEERAAILTTTQDAGGVVGPTEFAAQYVEFLKHMSGVLDAPITIVNSPTGQSFFVPTIDDTANKGAVKAEGVDSSAATAPTLANKELKSYLYDTGIIPLSYQMDRDNAIGILPMLARIAAMRISRAVNTDGTVGTGGGKITGFMDGATLGKTAASATVVTFDELIDLEHSINKAYRSRPDCAWQMRSTTLGAIRKLKDTAGNYIWQPGINGAPDTINGYKVFENDDMSAMTTGLKPIAFGNFGYYVLRKIGDPVFIIDRSAAMIKNNTYEMKIIQAFDGVLTCTAAIKYLQLA